MHSPEVVRVGEWAVLEAHWPGQPPQRIGLLIHDQTANILRAKIRSDWSRAHGDGELWRDLNADLERMSEEIGAQQVLDWLESTASHTVRLGAREAVTFSEIEVLLEDLYIQHVREDSRIEPEQAKETAISLRRSWRRTLGTSGSVLALAATIAFVAVRLVSHRPRKSPSTTAEMIQNSPALDTPLTPLLSEPFPTKRLDLTLPTNFSSSRHRATAVHQFPRRRNFHLNTVAATLRLRISHVSEPALPPPPTLLVATQTLPSAAPMSLPAAPDFRSRHRFFHALIIPFRAIAVAFLDHPINSATKSQQND